jgi:Xaa-Pro aminopeptidase
VTPAEERLDALRDELRKAGVQAFLAPRTDAHQNEYIQPADERLRFISGFSGTAGLAAITLKEAALFTDGRYLIQAERQIDPECWKLLNSMRDQVADYITERLAPGETLGFDPSLHRVSEIEKLTEKLAIKGVAIKPLLENPIDAIWRDRPARPDARAQIYPLAFAGESAGAKRARIAENLAKQGCAALLVSAPDNLSWAFNIRGGDVDMTPVVFGFALIRVDGPATLFLEPEKLGDAERAALAENGAVTVAAPSEMGAALAGLKGARVRLDQATASLRLAQLVREAGATPDMGADPITAMKAQKSEAELAGIRAAHRRDGVALTRYLAWLDRTAPGALDEWSAAEKLYELREGLDNFKSLSFPTISAAAGNAAEPHYQLIEGKARKFAEGDIYLVDSGGQYLDGTTDVTRVTVFGRPTDEMRRRYTQVLKGHVALSRARFPAGVNGAQLEMLARQFLWADGVDFDHGVGHGVGAYLSVHEGPQAISARGAGTPLVPGMLLSNEPGYYKRGEYGIRIENLIVVRKVAEPPPKAERELLEFETVTLAPYEPKLIDADMLTPEERDWINAYHAHVLEALGPSLTGEDARYLERCAQPL